MKCDAAEEETDSGECVKNCSRQGLLEEKSRRGNA